MAVVAVLGVGIFLARSRDPELSSSVTGDPASGELSTEAVLFEGVGGLIIHGSLELPSGSPAERRPAAVIVPGFGPTTRDGVSLGSGRVDALYRDASHVLAGSGMVVLRYDKRGTGESIPLPSAPQLEFDDYVQDAVAAIGFLTGRPEVDPSAVMVVGHDEGGLVAMRLAAEFNRSLAGLVLISTPGRPLVEVLAEEIRREGLGEAPRLHEMEARELEDAVGALLATGVVPDVRDALRPIFPADRPEYLRSIFSIDPVAEAERVGAPVLIVHGEQDPGIRGEDVQALRAALGSSSIVQVVHAPRAGHTLALIPNEVVGEAHDMGAAAGLPSRDLDALRRIAEWLGSLG